MVNARMAPKAKVARMDISNRALCFALRHPPKGQKKMKFDDIQKLVRKTDGKKPSLGAIAEAAKTFNQEKMPVGRRVGWRKTTKVEDKAILTAFHKVRPPGHGATSRKIHRALPTKIKRKICKRTVITRLAEKGYTYSV